MNPTNTITSGFPSSVTVPQKSSLVPVVTLFIFTSFTSWLIGYMSWTWLLLLPILSITFWIIKRRINHYEIYKTWCIRRNAARERLESHVESTEWINHMLEKIWTVLEPIVSSEVIKNVNSLLKEKKPSFLDSLELSEFTLGSNAPEILGAKVYPQTNPDTIHLDLELGFVPCDSDTEIFLDKYKTSSDRSGNQWPSKIVLITRIGKGILGVDVPVMIKEFAFFGKLRVEISLIPSISLVKTVSLSFLEQPKVEFVLKPLKAFDLMDLPGLSNWLYGMINDGLGSALVNPNHLDIDLTKGGGGGDLGPVIGVLKIKINQIRAVHSGHELCIRMQIANKIMAETQKLKEKEFSWNESFFLLIRDSKTPLRLLIMTPSNNSLANISLNMKSLMKSSFQGWKQAEASKIELDISTEYFSLESIEGGVKGAEEGEETENEKKDKEKEEDGEGESFTSSSIEDQACSAIVSISFQQIQRESGDVTKPIKVYYEIWLHSNFIYIDPEKTLPKGRYDPYYYRSVTKKGTAAPIWEDTFEAFVPILNSFCITIILRSASNDQCLALWRNQLAPVMNSNEWYDFGNNTGLRFHAQFNQKPIHIRQSELDMIVRQEPAIGLIKIQLQKGTGFKDTISRDKYYAILYVNESIMGRSKYSQDDKNPTWNANMTSLVQSEQDLLRLEFYTSRDIRKDQYYGKIELPILEAISRHAYIIERSDPIDLHDKTDYDRPMVTYSISYYPRIESNEEEKGEKENNQLIMTRDKSLSSSGFLYISQVAIKMENVKKHAFIDLFYNDEEKPFIRTDYRNTSGVWAINVNKLIKDVNDATLNVYLMSKKEFGSSKCIKSLELDLLKMTRDNWYSLDSHSSSKILIESQFFYLDTELTDPTIESGQLDVDIIAATNLIALDDSGTSDPYCQLFVNGKSEYKTKVCKENLQPEWNEHLVLNIEDKNQTSLKVEVRDWNRVMASRTMGFMRIDLSTLNTGEPVEFVEKLEGIPQGTIRIKLKFVSSSGKRGIHKPRIALVSDITNVPGELVSKLNPIPKFTNFISFDKAASIEAGQNIITIKSIKLSLLKSDDNKKKIYHATTIKAAIKIKRDPETLAKLKDQKGTGIITWNEPIVIPVEYLKDADGVAIKLTWNMKSQPEQPKISLKLTDKESLSPSITKSFDIPFDDGKGMAKMEIDMTSGTATADASSNSNTAKKGFFGLKMNK